MDFLLKIYRKIIPEKARRAYNEAYQKLRVFCINKRAMQRKSYGELNKDKTFYVIRTDSTQQWGVFTTCSMVLNNLKYASEHGWIPVVDYKNYFLVGLQEKERFGIDNAWEYYFEPCDIRYSLEEVYKSKHVILGPEWGQPAASLSWNSINQTEEIEDIFFKLVKEYIRIKPELMERAGKKMRELFPVGEKVLGVGIRAGLKWGELAARDIYRNHPKGPDIDEYIAETRKLMTEFHCGYVFVSCDDRYYLERMKEEFGEKCLYVDRCLPHFFDDNKPMPAENLNQEREGVPLIKRNEDYIIEIYILSRCDSLYAAKGGGAQAAILFNNKKYEHCVISYKGTIEGGKKI